MKLGDQSSAGWRKITVADVKAQCKGSVVSGPFGSNIGKRFFVDVGVPLIRGNNLTLGDKKFIDDGFVFITEEKSYELRNCEALPGDLIFTAAGTLGQVGIIPEFPKYPRYIISNKQLRLRCDPGIALALYLYYWFSSRQMRQYIINQNTGASVPLITLGHLRSFTIHLPPLPTQCKIAAILSAYDDLIENNLRRIKILEEMAQLIYQEWFVKFRFPGHENVRMVESEMGPIPEGWKVRNVTDMPCFRFVRENVAPYEGTKRYFATADVRGIEIVGEGITYTFEKKPSRAQKQPPVDSVWFARMKDTYKVLVFTDVNERWAKECMLSSGFAGFQASDRGWLDYLYCTIKSDAFHEEKNRYCTGATQMSLTNEGLKRIQVLAPDHRTAITFNQLTAPGVSEILVLQALNTVLRRTRDLLLPKLISGELDVSELDINTGEELA